MLLFFAVNAATYVMDWKRTLANVNHNLLARGHCKHGRIYESLNDVSLIRLCGQKDLLGNSVEGYLFHC